MLNTRITSLAAGVLALAAAVGTATAQQPGDTARIQNRDAGPATQNVDQRHPFEGVVATVDGNKITINAEGIPGMKEGATTLPYTIESGANLSQFNVGDRVTGEMIVKDNRTTVENVRVIGKADDDKDKIGAEMKQDAGQVKGEAKEQYGEVKNEAKDIAQGEKKTPPDSAEAAGPAQTGYTDPTDPSVKIYPFQGTVFEINEPARRITIDAERVPGNPGGETALPYIVPDSVQFSTFHEGDKVVGELIVKDNRTTVRSVQIMSSKSEQDAVKKEQKQEKKDKKDAPQN